MIILLQLKLYCDKMKLISTSALELLAGFSLASVASGNAIFRNSVPKFVLGENVIGSQVHSREKVPFWPVILFFAIEVSF